MNNVHKCETKTVPVRYNMQGETTLYKYTNLSRQTATPMTLRIRLSFEADFNSDTVEVNEE